MSASPATGFCRVTVVAPDSRVDVALPEDVPLADLYPEVLRLSGQTQAEGAPTGFHLVRRDGTVLSSGLSLAAQQVRDGDLLSLRPFAESLPPAVYDDVAEAVATAVRDDHRFWGPELLRAVGLTGAVLLFALMGLALWFSGVRHDMGGAPGVLAAVTTTVLVAFSGVRARVYDDRGTAVALGLAALPHALIAGSGALPVHDPGAQGPGRLQFLAGCVAVLLVSALLVGLLPEGDAPFVAAALVAGAGSLATFAAVVVPRVSADSVAAVAAVCAVAAVGFLPSLSARFARLPVGYQAPAQRRGPDLGDRGGRAAAEAVAYERIATRARRGHEVLVGLVGGCAAVAVGCSAVLGFAGTAWPRLLALAVGLATVLRARLFRYTAQVMCLVVGGLLAMGLLVLGLSLDGARYAASVHPGPAADLRMIWLSTAVAAGAAVLTAVAIVVPGRGVSPFWGRLLDLLDGLVLLALVPLVLAVLDVYATVRGMTG